MSKKINLALQGGGSHGAFTWGVLDRILEDEEITLDGVSGTSAGAMNAVVLAHGYALGRREGAREHLGIFWREVSKSAQWSIFRRSMHDKFTGNWNIDGSPAVLLAEATKSAVSPYMMNPGNFSPLRTSLAKSVDIEAVRNSPIQVFISATNVNSGRSRVFTKKDVSLDAILASACLPTLFQAVIIDDEPYWDGGYTGNPCIWPLIYECETRDVAIVQINPLIRLGIPQTPSAILNRMTEISFNASLMSEMRAVAFVENLLENNHLKGAVANEYKKMHIHRIHAEEDMRGLGVSSKMNAESDFIEYLFRLGRLTADKWLKTSKADIGHRSTVDLRETYL